MRPRLASSNLVRKACTLLVSLLFGPLPILTAASCADNLEVYGASSAQYAKMGWYEKTAGMDSTGRPIYQNRWTKHFLHYNSQWQIGPTTDRSTAGLQSHVAVGQSDTSLCPTDVTTWDVWKGNAWTSTQFHVMVTLAKTATAVCPHNVELRGLESMFEPGGWYEDAGLKDASGRPIYKQKQNGNYLYFWPSQEGWFVGGDYTSTDVRAYSTDGLRSECPTNSSGWSGWMIGNTWSLPSDFNTKVVPMEFVTDTCEPQVEIDNDANTDAAAMGLYTKTGSVDFSGRPIYQNKMGNHLFYWSAYGDWCVGDMISTFSLTVQSFGNNRADCPLHATSWRLRAGFTWSPHITVTLKVPTTITVTSTTTWTSTTITGTTTSKTTATTTKSSSTTTGSSTTSTTSISSSSTWTTVTRSTSTSASTTSSTTDTRTTMTATTRTRTKTTGTSTTTTATTIAVAWHVLPQTSLTGGEVNGGMPMTTMLTRDCGGNIWILGVVDSGVLKMVKIRVTGPTTSTLLGTRSDAEYDPRCAVQVTFNASCYFAAKSLEHDTITVASVAWGILPDTMLNSSEGDHATQLQVRLSRYLGNKVWLLGVLDGGVLKMAKVWSRTSAESEWLGSRSDSDFDPSCAMDATFLEACYDAGDDLGRDAFPISFRATEPPVSWSILPQTSITGSNVNGGRPLPVKLTRDLGNNVWLIGVVDDGILRMAKIKVSGPTTSNWLVTRSDADHDPSCAIGPTFGEACYRAGDVGGDAFSVSLAATEAPVAWSILPQTSFTGSEIDGGMPMPIQLKQDLGNNVWLLGSIDDGVLKMAKVKVQGPTSCEWLGTRNDTDYDPSCAVPSTFQEACYDAGDDLERDAYPVEPVAWGILPQTNLTSSGGAHLPVMLTRDLGNYEWLLGTVDNGVLNMVKLRVLGPRTSEWIGTRSDADYDPSCAIQVTFVETCYGAGNDLGSDAFSVSILAVEAPVSWNILPETNLMGSEVNGGTPLPVKLMLDLGNNVWLLGIIDEGVLKMVKVRVTGPATSEWLGTRRDDGYDPSCAVPVTFREACWEGGDDLSTDSYPVSLSATDGGVGNSLQACHGDLAQPLGDNSNGTNCPSSMIEGTTCTARCNSGAIANGTFVCLAGKIRLESICAGHVTIGDKVLLTLSAVASECPSPEQLRTILATALEVNRDTVDSVFCEAGEKVPLSQDDARLAGHPTARALTIGGDLIAGPEGTMPGQVLLQRGQQLADNRTAFGVRFTTALRDAIGYVGSVEQVHRPLHVLDQVTYFKDPVSWGILPQTTLTGSGVNGGTPLPVELMLDLGDNIWVLGVVDDGILKMVKVRLTGPATSEWLGTRSDADYDPSCAVRVTFREACWSTGDDLIRDAYPVSLRATEKGVGTSPGTCRGDLAQPLGDGSNGTNCPSTMVEGTTCAAQCNSGAAPNGTFICLAGKTRLESVCPGDDYIEMGDKVLFTLAAVASACPTQERMRTILANALQVDRGTVDGVFCNVGKQVQLAEDDARLAGKPTAMALTIGGELNVGGAAEAQDLLPRVARLSDNKTAVGNRFAIAMASAVEYVGSVEQLHRPLHEPNQVIEFHKPCHGDSAQALGNHSVGTTCPLTMRQGSTCAAKCISGNTPNGTFLCLAGKIRLQSICPGQGYVTMGDKVLFTLEAVASECPSPGEVHTIIAASLQVDRHTMDNVFCEAGKEVPLSEDDARLAGQPTARVLTIGGELTTDHAEAPDLLAAVEQLPDSMTPVGTRFATAMRGATQFMASIEQLHRPQHVPDQVLDFHEPCHGDFARSLGDDSNGTNCLTAMAERSTCAAKCNSGAAANGTFMCLAGRIRLGSVCPGQGSVIMGDKVLFTLSAVASECPLLEQLSTMLATALEKDRDTMDGVFCEEGKDVPLSEEDARRAGHPMVKTLTIGGEVNTDISGAQHLLSRVAQLPDSMTAVGARLATAMRGVINYMGAIEQVHRPLHVPDQLIDFHKPCLGDYAQPLGNDSMGTDCPTTMAEGSTCKAKCKSGGAPNGTFMCLASRIRLKSVCPGQDSVMIADKVLFTLAAVASECPSPEQLRAIFVAALEVSRETVDGVFCQARRDVLAGQPMARSLIIGGELRAHAGAEAQSVLLRASQLPDSAVAVGNRFAGAMRGAVDYLGYVKQVHRPILVPDQVIDVHRTCRGDAARPLGTASMGTNCPATMVQGSTCAARCNSGTTANGNFTCLAGKIRLQSVCPGQGSITMGGKVLFSMAAVASECPSLEQLRTILAVALQVARGTVDGVFCESGGTGQLFGDDARLAGHPMAKTVRIGGEINGGDAGSTDLLLSTAQLSDSTTAVGNRFAIALGGTIGHLGSVEHLHRPLHVPNQVADFVPYRTCGGDLAQPLGDSHNGTDCPAIISEGATCTAKCNSGTTTNGTFMCLAGKVRLTSVCAGQHRKGAVVLGDKVLFTLAAMASECPSPEQLQTILGFALGVVNYRNVVKGVFCDLGKEVPLSEEDARLAGRQTAWLLTIGGELTPDAAESHRFLQMAVQLADIRTSVGTRFAKAMWDAVHYFGTVWQLHAPLLVKDQVTELVAYEATVPPTVMPVPAPIGQAVESTGLASGHLAAVLVAAPFLLGMICVASSYCMTRCRAGVNKKETSEWVEV